MAFKTTGTKAAKFAFAAVMATSVVAVASTIETEAASQSKAEKQVASLEKLAAQLKKQTAYETRVKLYPKDKLGLPSATTYKATAAALKGAKAEVSKLKSGATKKKLQVAVANAEKVYNNATVYTKVVKSAKALKVTNTALSSALSKGKLTTTAVKANAKFTADLKAFNANVAKLAGKQTKKVFTSTFVAPFTKTNKSFKSAVTIQNDLATLKAYLKAGNAEKAVALQATIEQNLSTGKKNGYITGLLANNFGKTVSANAKTINANFLYAAKSTNQSAPTVFGGTATNVKVVNHDLVIEAGKNEYITVANLEVNGNIIIKGDKTGSGSVTFDNVKVNAVNGKGGEIVVNDVAKHSLYTKNVTAAKLNVKDVNGANIVTQEGTKIAVLNVISKASEKGNIHFHASKGSFQQVFVVTTGEKTDVTFDGDYTGTSIDINAPKSVITIAKTAIIDVLNVKSDSKITAVEGAKVLVVNLAVTKQGQQVELAGSLKDAKVNVLNANVQLAIALNAIIKEIAKDPTITGVIVIINNGGKVETSTGVTVPNTNTPPVGGGGGGGGQTEAQAADSTIDSLIDAIVNAQFANPTYATFGSLTDSVQPDYTFTFNSNFANTKLYDIKQPIENSGTNIQDVVANTIINSGNATAYLTHLPNIRKIVATSNGKESKALDYALTTPDSQISLLTIKNQLSYSGVSNLLGNFMAHDTAANTTVTNFIYGADGVSGGTGANAGFETFNIVITFSDASTLNYTVTLDVAN